MKLRKNKKSQMEIMGLVIIVILITLGLFFVVRFMITKEPSEIKKSYTRTEVAANILNSLLKTTSKDCYGMTTTQLLQDCAVNYEFTTSQVRCENGEYSCTYVQSIIQTIFDNTLKEWGNQNFDFKVYMQGNEENIILRHKPEGSEGCKGEREAKQSYIPTEAGILAVTLEVC